MICMENLNTWWLWQAWHSPSMAVPGCSNYLSAPVPKQESLSYALRPDSRAIFGLCGMSRQIWIIVMIMLWQTSMGLPRRCPWTNLIASVANILIPFPIFSPSLPSCLCFAFSVCLLSNKNSALTTFFSPLLYPILGFLGNLSFTWYYWHSYLVGLHVPTAAYKLHVKLNHFSSNFTIISTRSSHPSQSYLKFVHLLTLSYPGISHVTSHIVSMSWSVCLMWGQCQHLTSVLILLLAKSLHRCLCAFLNSKNCFSSP